MASGWLSGSGLAEQALLSGSRPLISVTSRAQIGDNLAALDFGLPAEIEDRLEEASRPALTYPYYFSGATMGTVINAGTTISSR